MPARQMWTAPPNTELEVAKHQRALDAIPIKIDEQLVTQVLQTPDVGFDPEQYTSEGKGFYVRLEDDGRPAEGSETSPQIIHPSELEGLNLPDGVQTVEVGDD